MWKAEMESDRQDEGRGRGRCGGEAEGQGTEDDQDVTRLDKAPRRDSEHGRRCADLSQDDVPSRPPRKGGAQDHRCCPAHARPPLFFFFFFYVYLACLFVSYILLHKKSSLGYFS